METLKQVLMRRDDMTCSEAHSLIAEAKDELLSRVADGDFIGAEEICLEYFGLEEDYLHELIF